MITDILGLHLVDTVSGEFSVGANGIQVTGGRMKHALSGFTASGTFRELLSGIDGVGNDLIFYGPFGSPTVRVRSMSIGGT